MLVNVDNGHCVEVLGISLGILLIYVSRTHCELHGVIVTLVLYVVCGH